MANARNVVTLDPDFPLEIAAPFGCGIQTGAGAVLNTLRPAAGTEIAVFGTGGVGLAAVLAARIAGCTTIIGVDRASGAARDGPRSRRDPHHRAAQDEDAVAAVMRITGTGADFSLEATGSPQVFRQAVDCPRRPACAA